MRVKLVVKTGELIGYIQILPFQIAPEVLVWGERVFVVDPERKEEGVTVYVEGMMYVTPQGTQPRPKPIF